MLNNGLIFAILIFVAVNIYYENNYIKNDNSEFIIYLADLKNHLTTYIKDKDIDTPECLFALISLRRVIVELYKRVDNKKTTKNGLYMLDKLIEESKVKKIGPEACREVFKDTAFINICE
jgi:hypothetical protein